MMAVANESPLTPGASSEEVGRGWFGRVLFMYADRPRKKSYSKQIIYLFLFIIYIAPKTMESHLPPWSTPLEPPFHSLLRLFCMLLAG